MKIIEQIIVHKSLQSAQIRSRSPPGIMDNFTRRPLTSGRNF